MIKSKIIGNKSNEVKSYPRLMTRTEGNETIVTLMFDLTSGVILISNTDKWKVGELHTHFRRNSFQDDFKGSITLSNK